MRYTSEDPNADVDAYAEVIVEAAHEQLGDNVRLLVEPGRSLVAPTAVSVYTVVSAERATRDGGAHNRIHLSLVPCRMLLQTHEAARRATEEV